MPSNILLYVATGHDFCIPDSLVTLVFPRSDLLKRNKAVTKFCIIFLDGYSKFSSEVCKEPMPKYMA